MTQNRRTVVDPREAERRRSLIFKIVAAVALVAIAAGVAVWAVMKNQEESNTGGSAVPTVAQPDGSIRITAAPKGTEPKAVLSIVEDFQCPACGSFETAFGSTIESLHANPAVAVDYKPIVFLDRNFGNDYSARTANAAMCVAESTAKGGDFGPWLNFHKALFANQSSEGGSGPSDDQLREMAREAGAGGAGQCITDQQFGEWIADRSNEVLADKDFSGTPWVRINGTRHQPSTPDALVAAVEAAAK